MFTSFLSVSPLFLVLYWSREKHEILYFNLAAVRFGPRAAISRRISCCGVVLKAAESICALNATCHHITYYLIQNEAGTHIATVL